MNSESAAPETSPTEWITLGGGCFWCLEAVFQRLEGVREVISGYAGGARPNPTYREICTGTTGHAEVVRIGFDPARISLEKLLEVFWAAHDPTTLNRQGNDVGTQYRSVIYWETPRQQAVVEAAKTAAQSGFRAPVVTEVAALTAFYPAEDFHQNYFNENAGTNPYCSVVIRPKLRKLLQSGLLKE